MCELDFNISFVFMKPLYLSQWCWLGHWCSQEVTWCLQLRSALFVDPPAELRGSTWSEPARWPNNIECLSISPGTMWMRGSLAWIHRSQSAAMLITLVLLLSAWVIFVYFFFLMPKVQMHFRHISIKRPHVCSCVYYVEK